MREEYKYKFVFPAIEKWMQEHGYTRKSFLREVGGGEHWMTGFCNPSYKVIRNVLELTGMTFEEAFREG